MKILVLGGSGMAGHTISIYLEEIGHDVTVFSRRRINFCKNINGDVRNIELITEIIVNGNYDAVINAVGILNTSAENNKPDAVLINSYLPHFLSKITEKSKTKIIHLSTDCVFSGKTGNYEENSFKDGETFYDRTKALGEINNEKDLTFRNSIIGPDINKEGIGLMNWFLLQRQDVYGYTQAIWTGVTTLTLAKAINQALNQNLYGLYNLVNNKKISKYDLLVLFNNHLKISEYKVFKNDEVVIDKSLVNTRTDFSFEVPSYEMMIIEVKDWMNNHKELYPHYFEKDVNK